MVTPKILTFPVFNYENFKNDFVTGLVKQLKSTLDLMHALRLVYGLYSGVFHHSLTPTTVLINPLCVNDKYTCH